jgi:hypothetical protein
MDYLSMSKEWRKKMNYWNLNLMRMMLMIQVKAFFASDGVVAVVVEMEHVVVAESQQEVVEEVLR